MMERASDIIAKVASIMFLPISWVIAQVGRVFDQMIFLEETPFFLALGMNAVLFVLLAWRHITAMRANKEKRRYYESKRRKDG